MGFGGDIYPRACLHAGPISICQDSILASRLRRELDTCSALPISTKHPMVLTAERDAFFGADRHGRTTLSRGISKRSGFTALPQLVVTQTATNYYFGGRLIKNTTGFVTPDRIGSIGKYFPYGQERPSATTNGKEKFATYFRDSETGLDYADQRYHQVGMGRFMTPDPYSGSASANDPGSWNRYAYSSGDPVNNSDPSGLDSSTSGTCDPAAAAFNQAFYDAACVPGDSLISGNISNTMGAAASGGIACPTCGGAAQTFLGPHQPVLRRRIIIVRPKPLRLAQRPFSKHRQQLRVDWIRGESLHLSSGFHNNVGHGSGRFFPW